MDRAAAVSNKKAAAEFGVHPSQIGRWAKDRASIVEAPSKGRTTLHQGMTPKYSSIEEELVQWILDMKEMDEPVTTFDVMCKGLLWIETSEIRA